MAKYVTHSNNGDGTIEIKPIENGFIIKYRYLLGHKEEFVRDIEELNEWLCDFYRIDSIRG